MPSTVKNAQFKTKRSCVIFFLHLLAKHLKPEIAKKGVIFGSPTGSLISAHMVKRMEFANATAGPAEGRCDPANKTIHSSAPPPPIDSGRPIIVFLFNLIRAPRVRKSTRKSYRRRVSRLYQEKQPRKARFLLRHTIWVYDDVAYRR